MIAYKYRSGRGVKDCEGNDVFKRDIDLLVGDSIYIPTVEQLNDPSEAFVNDEVINLILRLFSQLVDSDTVHREIRNELIAVCQQEAYQIH